MTVGEKILAWLDEIGADGLMRNNEVWGKDAIEDAIAWAGVENLVPAFRHADESDMQNVQALHRIGRVGTGVRDYEQFARFMVC